MSGIAGQLRFDGGPADADLVATLAEAVRHRGPDAGGCWADGPVALGLRLLRTTPESAAESGPRRDALDDLCLVLDGRVDNREALHAELRGAGFEPRGGTDADYVLAAWRAWQEDAPRRILGDFAFALWDGRRKVLFCARDILGLRPFHYARSAERLLFGSELHQLLLDPAVPATLDEGMIGEFLAYAITSAEDSFYAGVKRLPPAHWMRVEAGGRLRIERYWEVDFNAAIRHPNAEDYARHLRELLEQSVRCRLRAHGRIGVDLSGGLDSSAVCLLADRLAGPERLRAFTVSYPNFACDETRYSDAVARRLAMPRSTIENRALEPHAFERRAARYRDFPGYPVSETFFGSLAPEASRHGCRVLFAGNGGDEWFTGEPDHLADLLGAGAFGSLLRNASRVGAATETPLPGAVWRHGAKPWLRHLLRSPLRRLRPRALEWLRPDWVRRIGLRERLEQLAVPPGGSWAQRAKRAWTMSAHTVHDYEMVDRLASGAGIEYRHPLLDRRLIEFAFATPPGLHYADGMGKSLLRRSLSDLLPAELLERRGKADFSELNCRAMDDALAHRPMQDWPAARAGWIRAGVLTREYLLARTALRETGTGGSAIWKAWMAHASGLMLEARPGVAPCGKLPVP